MLVLRFDGPAATTIGSAGLAALRLGTEPLMPAVPNIGIEQLPAMHALTLIGLGHPSGWTPGNSARKSRTLGSE